MPKPKPPTERKLEWWRNNSRLGDADVLLSRTPGSLGDRIANFTGGNYTHTMLWDEEQQLVLNATKIDVRRPWKDQGVMPTDLAELVPHKAYVDVYRYRTLTEDQKVRIISNGRKYMTVDKFHFGALVQCAFRAKWNRHLFRLGVVGKPFLNAINCWIRTSAARGAHNGMMCAEYVSLAYGDSGVPIKIKLRPNGAGQFYIVDPDNYVQSVSQSDQVPSDEFVSDGEVDEMIKEFNKLDNNLHATWNSDRLENRSAFGGFSTTGIKAAPSLGEVEGIAGEDLAFGLMSPRHFEESPSFELIGRILP